jgi:ribokinase
MPQLTIFGSINMDLVVRVSHLPQPGETILGWDYQAIPGGKGANQAVAAARLGAKVAMIGRVGQDAFGGLLLENLRREEIDVNAVQSDPQASSGNAMITLDEQGRNTIVVAPGANMAITPSEVIAALDAIAIMDVLLLQLESPVECVFQAARLAHARGSKVVFNPAPARDLPDEIYRYIDVLVPNESETSLLSGLPVATLEQAEAAAHKLLASGAGSVVLTLGGRGALVIDGSQPAVHIPAHSVQVVDTTAAGDAFVAGLAVGLAEGVGLVEAARLGNAAGAIAVTRLGAQPAMPRRAEIERILR